MKEDVYDIIAPRLKSLDSIMCYKGGAARLVFGDEEVLGEWNMDTYSHFVENEVYKTTTSVGVRVSMPERRRPPKERDLEKIRLFFGDEEFTGILCEDGFYEHDRASLFYRFTKTNFSMPRYGLST